jgi:plastocyanin
VTRSVCRIGAATLVGLLAASFAGAQSRGGTITGHVTLAGKPPGNSIIRMGMDPACADLNRGRRVIQESALVTADGSVANAFISLDGTFPPTPVPTTPVVIDQRACVYGPRVVGVRVGQRLQIRSDDNVLHNVHSSSVSSNSFNVAQAKAGAVFDFTPKAPEVMLKLGCDIHRWMTAYVGVVPHPYFSVSDASGHFSIANVPAGTYKIKTWHERFGEQSRSVTVRAGATVTVDFGYQGG